MYESIKQRLWALVEDRNFTFLDTTRARAEAYLDKFRVFEGISEEEVVAIEAELNYRFPEEFREYLKTFGKKGGLLFEAGADLRASEIVSYQSMGRGMLGSDMRKDFFKEDTIVFYQHQGYTFCCFHKDEKGEMGIYYYADSYENNPPKKIYSNFMEMMELEMKIIEKQHEEMKEMGGYFVKLEEGSEQHGSFEGATTLPRDAEDYFSD